MSKHTIKVVADCAPALEALQRFRAIYYREQSLPKLSEMARAPIRDIDGLDSRLVSNEEKDA